MPSTALEVKRVQSSEDLLHPGEFVFIPKRQPIRTVEQIAVEPPKNRLQRLWWNWFGTKYALREVLELVWPEIDTVILNCPDCNNPLATTRNHKIISTDPLTIEMEITCPYCRTNTFKVAEGKIMTA